MGSHVCTRADSQTERPLEVDAERLVVQVFGNRLEILVERRHSGIVDEDVDATEVLEGAVDQRVAVVPLADVACDGERTPSGRCLDLLRSQLAGIEFPGSDDDVGAGFGEYLAMARPIPREPPVMMAVLPVRSCSESKRVIYRLLRRI